ncbi:MAG: hypothetical protein AAGI46_00865 [Planctomycetota bacterium]
MTSAGAASATVPGGHRRWDVPAAMAVVLLVFTLVHNPYWVPTGDGEVFLTAARNLASGDGLTYLGEPLRIVAPGWPATLAGLLWLGDGRIVVMKLAQIAFMAIGLFAWLMALQRGRTRHVAAGSVMLAAIASPLYPLTFWPHSDAIFVAFAGGSVWAAAMFRATGRWRWLGLTCGLLAVGIAMRWAGLPFAVVPAAICVGTRRGGKLAAGITGAIAVLLTGAIAFGLVLSLVRSGTLIPLATSVTPSLFVREIPEMSLISEVWFRLQRLPDWVGWTLFAPMRFLGFGGGGAIGEWLNRSVGWLAVLLLATAAIVEARRGRWLFLGVLAYVVGLAAAWPFPNSRYLVPILPGLIAGILVALHWAASSRESPALLICVAGLGGIATLFFPFEALPLPSWLWWLRPLLDLFSSVAGLDLLAGFTVTVAILASARGGMNRWHPIRVLEPVTRVTFIAMFVLVNAAMWATDVWIARSGDADTYYARYEAGLHWNLMAVADELADSEGSIAVSERYENLNERWDYQHAERVVAYIADRPSTPVPGPLTGWSVKKLQQWARDNDVAWYVHQNPTVPGRVWHFRLTPDEHAAVTQRERPGPREWQFELYRMQNFAGPDEPPRKWLTPHVTPPLVGDRLHEIATRVPHWPGGERDDR